LSSVARFSGSLAIFASSAETSAEYLVSIVLTVLVVEELDESDVLVLEEEDVSVELLWSVVASLEELSPEKIAESEGSIMESAMTTAMTPMAILALSGSPPS